MSLIDRLNSRVNRLEMQLHGIHMAAEARDPEHGAMTPWELNQIGRLTGLINTIKEDIAVAEHAADTHGANSRQVIQAVNLRRRMDRLQKQKDRIPGRPESPQRARQVARLQQQMSTMLVSLQEILGGPNVGTPPTAPPTVPGTPLPPTPGLPVIHRDPHNLATEPEFDSMFRAFSADPPTASPETPDRIAPDRMFRRQFSSDDFLMQNQKFGDRVDRVEIWGFRDNEADDKDLEFPSAPIRVVENEIIHTELKPSKGPHSIHWHGIEPTAMNDGIGKLTFEVSGDYIYQWKPSEAGTYFYHCHRNTVLHFEMGMYGMLIIDPKEPEGADIQAPYPMGGPGYVRRMDELIRYDAEAIWVSDDIDPRWHEMSHSAGLGFPFGNDAGLNRWDPHYFLISGRSHPWSANRPTDPEPGVAAVVALGQTLLVRLVCAAYTINEYTIERVGGGGTVPEVIAIDGNTLGHSGFNRYSRPFDLVSPFELTAARRYDLLFQNMVAGIYKMTVNFLDWITREKLGFAETFIFVE